MFDGIQDAARNFRPGAGGDNHAGGDKQHHDRSLRPAK
jgi:hypothetical protein